MYKLDEQDYVVGGMFQVVYLPFENYPYITYYEDLTGLGTITNGGVFIGELISRYLESSNIVLSSDKYSLRVNKIRIVHMQANNDSVQTNLGITSSMIFWPPTNIEFSFYRYNYNNINSIINATNYTNFKNINDKPFVYNSDIGEYVWDFDEKTNVPGYGSFFEYRDFTLNRLSGLIYARGFYTSYNALLWDYRRCRIYISITIRKS